MEIALVLDPAAEDERAVLEGLIAYNKQAGGPTGYQPIAVLLKNDSGGTLGGLTGRAVYDWLFIEMLHIPEEFRGAGIGSQLMAKAEAFARQHGLAGIWLDTYDFQARGFYEKLGFTVFGTLEDHPRGGRRFFLEKRFDASPAN